MARLAYFFDTQLSPNIVKREDNGFLICKDVVIARTGLQKYKVSELPADQLKAMGRNYEPNDMVEVCRPEEEVFRPETIASFEGMPITDGHPPNEEFVNSDNVERLQRGHVQNVRRGIEPLPSGDWPLLADAVITHADLISDVENNRKRQLSCGYDFNLGQRNGCLEQQDILGNHVAVVPRGRAGGDARINDSAPPSVAETPMVAVEEKKSMKGKYLSHLLGLGLKTFAKDAEPDQVAEAAEELRNHQPAAEELKAKDAVAAPAKEVEEEGAPDHLHKALDKVYSKHKKARDTKAKDVDLEELKTLLGEYFDEEEEEPEHQEDAAEEEGEEEFGDEPDDDDALAETAEDEEPEGSEAERQSELTEGVGEDIEGFKDESGTFHPIRAGAGYKGAKAGDPKKKAKKKKTKAKDALLIQPFTGSDASPVRQDTGSGVAAAAAVLRMLRPAIARGDKKALQRAFDAAASVVNKARRQGGNGYAAFGRAAMEPDRDRVRAADAAIRAVDSTAPGAVDINGLNAEYAKRHRQNPSEVK